MDIGIRPQGGGRKTHLLQPDYFENVDTENKAYWLGFLYADGGVSKYRLSINVKPSDFYHIKRFQKEIGSEHKCYPVKSIKSKAGTMRVDISSLKMVTDLTAQGCHANKTWDLEPPHLPSELVRHFVRGFWDGDGSIGRYGKYFQLHMSATGTDSMIAWMAGQFPAPAYVGRAGGQARVRSTSRSALDNLNFMYHDSNVHLDRKYEVYRAAWLHHEFGE